VNETASGLGEGRGQTLQYFKPKRDHLFVGDCMPFFHDDTLHVYYLLDENHHKALDGLGGHQWAHASSTDLMHWMHHPLAIAITHAWEGSICTGTTFYDKGLFYGFYATRMRDRTQHLGLATSQDGIHFQKNEPNPFASPPTGYDPYHYRDPFVFRDDRTGLYHMLVTASLEEYPIHDRGGCLAHLVSTDLTNWDVCAPFLVPGLPGVPECPDYFFWNGWYYLIFSHGGAAHYRMSRAPFGPWHRPRVDTFDGGAAYVMKTAAFTGGRRIGVAFIGTRKGHKDMGRLLFGGQMVLREIIQHEDGTLGTMFPSEMIPPTDDALRLAPIPLTSRVTATGQQVRLQADEGLEVAMLAGIPTNARIRVTVRPEAHSALFSLFLKGAENLQSGYELRFLPFERRVELLDQAIICVDGLGENFTVDIILTEDLIDVCIDQRQCLINRCAEFNGDRLFFCAHNAAVVFDAIEIKPLIASWNDACDPTL